MIFAVIPWGKKYENNAMFDYTDKASQSELNLAYKRMKLRFEELGHVINTIDLYKDLTKVDFFLFFDFFPEWVIKLTKLGLDSKMVYCNAEPPTVKIINSEEGYEKLKKIFPYIMTWNKDLIDNKRIFWRTIPYIFEKKENKIPFSQKKLLTSISANKKSNYKYEIYSTREELISFFEKAIPDQFDMFGSGWDGTWHSSYRGRAQDKAETYSHYKYALALENTRNVNGYVTEKIFDCLTSGIVPIYLGADDILDYVPKECFIDYRNFGTPQKLMDYILSITKEKYDEYIKAANQCISSDELAYHFSGEMYADNILYMVKEGNMEGFQADRVQLLKIKISIYVHKIIQDLKKWLKELSDRS